MDTDLVERVESELMPLESGERFRYEFDSERMEPSVALISAVAAVTDTVPSEVDPPLHDIIDPDAIDSLFATRTQTENDDSDSLIFYVGGCRVYLYPDDRVEVVPVET